MSLFDALYTLYTTLTNPTTAILYLRAVGLVMVSWLAFGASLAGGGVALRRVFGLRSQTAWDWLIAVWVGWALLLGLLQIWHIVAPINRWAGWLLLPGVVGLGWNTRDLLPLLRRHVKWGVLLSVVGFFIAGSAIGPANEGDYALYHGQAILWAETYPAVPGLGNLHGRLAFNNSVFLWAAWVEAMTGAGNHIASSTLIMAALSLAAWGIARTLHGDLTPRTLFMALTLPVIAWTLTHNDHLRTPDNDLPTILLGLLIFALLLTMFRPFNNRLNTAYAVLLILLLAAAGTTVKLSFAAYGGTAALIALFLWWRGGSPAAVRLAAWGAAFVMLLGMGWVGRGVILSGYPAYPATVGGFDVDWRVSCEAAQLDADYIYSWARQPGAAPADVLSGWGWLNDWLVRTLRRDREVFTPLLILGGVLLAKLRFRRQFQQTWLALLVPLVGLAFWFITAPDPRFAGAAFWVLAYGAAALLLAEFAINAPNGVRVLVITAALLLAYDTRGTFILYPPAPQTGFHRVPPADVTAVTLESGLTVNIPTERAETGSGEERCYRAALPCAPVPPPSLMLREPDNLAAGFRVDDVGICR